MNPWNPFRPAASENFFEMRDQEEYFERNSRKDNINNAQSLH